MTSVPTHNICQVYTLTNKCVYVSASCDFNYFIQIVWKPNLALQIDVACFVDAHLVAARMALKRFCKIHPFGF